MHILNEYPGISLRTLAARMESEPATITRMVRRMEVHGLIRRELDPEDSRVHHFYLTERGQFKRRETEEVHRELGRRLFRGFSKDEKAFLETAFARMTENIRKEGK